MRTLRIQEWRARSILFHLALINEYLPLVKRVQFEGERCGRTWVEPEVFLAGVSPDVRTDVPRAIFRSEVWSETDISGSSKVPCEEYRGWFPILKNVRDLSITGLALSKFREGTTRELCFGHLSHKLRSLTLVSPRGTNEDLLDFLGLFPFLDDIEISDFQPPKTGNPPSGSLVWRRPEGRLALKDFGGNGLLRQITCMYEGMRFESVVLHGVQEAHRILETCAGSVKILQVQPGDRQYCKEPLDLWEHLIDI